MDLSMDLSVDIHIHGKPAYVAGLVYRAVCPFVLQLVIAPTHGRMARLSWPDLT